MFTMCVPGPYGGQERASDSLEQDYKQLRSTIWELGTEPLPSARAAISPGPCLNFLPLSRVYMCYSLHSQTRHKYSFPAFHYYEIYISGQLCS